MESQPQNPEFGINPENFHPCRQKEKGVLNFRIYHTIFNQGRAVAQW